VPGSARLLAEELSFLRIGTGSTAGTYFPIGGILASVISSPPGSRACDQGGSCGVPGLIAVAQSTEGSVYNVAAIAGGELESGLSQADIAYWAYHAEGIYDGMPANTKLRAIANLYPESLQIVVSVMSGIRRVPDLAGMRISLDRDGSGTRADAELVLDAWGLTPADLKPRYINVDEAIDEMRAGELDGFFLVAGTPTFAVQDLAQQMPVTLVPVDGPEVAALRKRYPFFSPQLIHAGLYHSVPATQSLSVGAQWLISVDVPNDTVYQITRALWHPNTRRLLDSGHPKGKLINFQTALNGLGVPLHPGARRFYEERGVTIIETLEE
jgi:TRAP transporter TAXI family solute receptor